MGLFDSPTHLLIVLAVLVVLFGSAKLPKAAKSMGEAMRIFKKEAQKLHDDDAPATGQVQAAAQPQVAQPQPTVIQQPVQPTVIQQPVQNPSPATTPLPETEHTNQPG